MINMEFKSGRNHRSSLLFAIALFGILLPSLTGCSSLSGVNAIPVRRIPPALLGRGRSDMQEITLTRLRQDSPDVYDLGPEDILGIYIENVLGEPEEAPPVHFPEDSKDKPSIGYPIPIRDDGTISLPLIPPIKAEGKTLEKLTEEIRRAYTIDHKILPEDSDRIIVTLIKKRTIKVMVIRQEAGGQDGITKKGTGFTVELAAYENDVLHALNETGGMPGIDAKNEIYIQRGAFKNSEERDREFASIQYSADPCCDPSQLEPDDPNTTVIPLRYYPENFPRFDQKDVILADGDILLIKSRDQDKFYTGGALPGGEYDLPRDYDLDILGAIAIAKGPVGGIGSGANFSAISNNGGGNKVLPPSRAVILRKTPGKGEIPILINLKRTLSNPNERILVQPGDVIIVEYTVMEEVVNTIFSIVRVNFLLNGFNGGGF